MTDHSRSQPMAPGAASGRWLLALAALCLLVACGRSQPDKREPALPSPAPPSAAVAPLPPAPAPPVAPAAAANPLAAELQVARAPALCELAKRVDPARDAALLGPALDKAFSLRRDEQAGECSFALTRALEADAHLLALARTTTAEARWMAIIYHANRSLRARHFEVYALALDATSEQVHHAVAGGLGAYGPEPEVIDLLGRAIDHRNENVRLKAARALIEIGGEAAIAVLRRRAKVEQDKAVVVTIHRALNKP